MSGQFNYNQRLGAVSKTFASVSSYTDLKDPRGDGFNFRPIKVRCEGAGDLAVEYWSDGTNSVQDTVHFKAGETQEMQPDKLLASGTTATGITVWWA